ncbi:MAG: hypothetical protein ACPLQP_11480 [Moorellaceae bacterium]
MSMEPEKRKQEQNLSRCPRCGYPAADKDWQRCPRCGAVLRPPCLCTGSCTTCLTRCLKG